MGRFVRAKSHSLCLLCLSEEQALNTITPVSFSNLWKLIAFREIRAETTRISSSKSKASLSTADRQCLGMDNLRVFFAGNE